MPSDPNEILRNIIEKGEIDEKALRETALAYSKLNFECEPRLNQKETHVRIFNYQRDMRIFLIRKVISQIYPKRPPSLLIECGSAGDISAALALPATSITAVDIDPDIYINEINEIPQEWFDAMGMKKGVAYYNDASRKRFYSKNKKIVDDCLPNYKRVVADGKNLEYEDESYDFALVQGTPDMINIFKRELGRVLKPGGYLTSIVMEEERPVDSPSFYEMGVYVHWPEYKKTNPKQEKLPFETVEIPEDLKNLETLCSWNSSGEMFSAGVVFEIYRKKE